MLRHTFAHTEKTHKNKVRKQCICKVKNKIPYKALGDKILSKIPLNLSGVVCTPSETPLKKNTFSFASGY